MGNDCIDGGVIPINPNIEPGAEGWHYEVSKLRALVSAYCGCDELMCVVRATNARILYSMFVDMIGHGCKKLSDKGYFIIDGDLNRAFVFMADRVVRDNSPIISQYEGCITQLPVNVYVNMKRGGFNEEDVDKRLTLYVRRSEIVLDGGQKVLRYNKRVVQHKD